MRFTLTTSLSTKLTVMTYEACTEHLLLVWNNVLHYYLYMTITNNSIEALLAMTVISTYKHNLIL